jgi:hypothetical protein
MRPAESARALKLRFNKLVKAYPLALAARIALEIEDANLSAKRYGYGKWMDRNYAKKQELIRELITLFPNQERGFDVHAPVTVSANVDRGI